MSNIERRHIARNAIYELRLRQQGRSSDVTIEYVAPTGEAHTVDQRLQAWRMSACPTAGLERLILRTKKTS